jgi:hypothetical protein
MQRIDLSGRRFSKLVAIKIVGRTPQNRLIWLCRCDCGNNHRVTSSHLISGLIKSCGCWRVHIGATNQLAHGCARRGNHTPEYRSYNAAKRRCTNPKVHNYHRYGGRGIQFKFESFQQFFAEVGKRPTKRHSIDRFPNNDGHYEPGNVRWATSFQQARNKQMTEKHLAACMRNLSKTPSHQ